ncbi:polyprotein [Phytophthora megakarya]|uniref:Polyprotein n=1 Tax=Phytophthora megakarya TaxID=4795 RepID=A0A225X2T6_9STRA|nr:polyprotein [Phytophthora megakarya]
MVIDWEYSRGFQVELPENGCGTLVACDAKGHGQKEATTPHTTQGTKHVDTKHDFIHDIMERGMIKVDYIDTKRQLTDLLLKALRMKTLKYLTNASDIKMKITAQ